VESGKKNLEAVPEIFDRFCSRKARLDVLLRVTELKKPRTVSTDRGSHGSNQSPSIHGQQGGIIAKDNADHPVLHGHG
jgi:hypothetical protein